MPTAAPYSAMREGRHAVRTDEEYRMPQDFSEFFKKYTAVIADADSVFRTVRERYAENVRCEKGCSDCCHALFDLTLVEALYLNTAFNAKFSGAARNTILQRADESDRAVHKLKKAAVKAVKDGENAAKILDEMAKVRVRCPLLSDEGLCEMYDERPATCRIYGVPTAIGSQAHTCAKSGFEPGKQYPTVYLDRIQDRLYALSHELASSINSRYSGLGEVLVPASLALLTEYTDEYLGLDKDKKAEVAAPLAAVSVAPAAAPRRPTGPVQMGRARAAAPVGKGMAECAGCSPDAKKGGCAGCNPTSFTIGGPAPAKKAPAKKATAKTPAAKTPAVKKAKG